MEIIKAGIPRFFPRPERLLLEHEGHTFQPDLILVGFVPNDVMDTYPAHRLRQWAERENVLFIATLPAISHARQTETLYWKKDSHCNSRGYQAIAETPFTALTRQAIIPSKTFTESSLQFHTAPRAETPNMLIIDSVRLPSNDVPKRLYQPTD